jgi:hypothetical protein
MKKHIVETAIFFIEEIRITYLGWVAVKYKSRKILNCSTVTWICLKII